MKEDLIVLVEEYIVQLEEHLEKCKEYREKKIDEEIEARKAHVERFKDHAVEISTQLRTGAIKRLRNCLERRDRESRADWADRKFSIERAIEVLEIPSDNDRFNRYTLTMDNIGEKETAWMQREDRDTLTFCMDAYKIGLGYVRGRIFGYFPSFITIENVIKSYKVLLKKLEIIAEPTIDPEFDSIIDGVFSEPYFGDETHVINLDTREVEYMTGRFR
jgi:hypothetical protein